RPISSRTPGRLPLLLRRPVSGRGGSSTRDQAGDRTGASAPGRHQVAPAPTGSRTEGAVQLMANHTDGESRLRRFAQAFRREANPRPDLATSLMAGLGERRRQSRFAMLPAVAMAAFVLVAGLGLAFGAMELRSLGHPSPTPPVSLMTPTPSATPEVPSPSPSPTPPATPSAVPAGA